MIKLTALIFGVSTSKDRDTIKEGVNNINNTIKEQAEDRKRENDSLINEFRKTQVSSEKEIKKALEETKTSILNQRKTNGKDPYIGLSTKGIYTIENGEESKGYDKDRIYYRAHFNKNEAVATNLNIKTFLLFEYEEDGQIKYEKHSYSLFENIDEVTVGESDAPLGWTQKTLKVKNFYLYMKGTYTNFSGTNTYSIDKLYCYNLKDNSTFMKVGPEKNRIIEIIKGED